MRRSRPWTSALTTVWSLVKGGSNCRVDSSNPARARSLAFLNGVRPPTPACSDMTAASRKSRSASPTWSGSLRDVKTPQAIMTIGHSTRAIDEFINLLKEHGVKRLVDIRTVPRSHHNPQFDGDELPNSLRSAH